MFEVGYAILGLFVGVIATVLYDTFCIYSDKPKPDAIDRYSAEVKKQSEEQLRRDVDYLEKQIIWLYSMNRTLLSHLNLEITPQPAPDEIVLRRRTAMKDKK